jgi:hypothetical protein
LATIFPTRIAADVPEAPPAEDKLRKQATQARAATTIEIILEAAAHILERDGFEGWRRCRMVTTSFPKQVAAVIEAAAAGSHKSQASSN